MSSQNTLDDDADEYEVDPSRGIRRDLRSSSNSIQLQSMGTSPRKFSGALPVQKRSSSGSTGSIDDGDDDNSSHESQREKKLSPSRVPHGSGNNTDGHPFKGKYKPPAGHDLEL